jgi:hypothetical protein
MSNSKNTTKRKGRGVMAELPDVKLLTSHTDILNASRGYEALALSLGLHDHPSMCGSRIGGRVFPGYGKDKADLPTIEEIVEACKRYILRAKRLQEAQAAAQAQKGRGKAKGEVESPQAKPHKGGHGEDQPALEPDETLETGTDGNIALLSAEAGNGIKGHGPTMLLVSGAIGSIMHAGRFKSRVARRFNPLKGEVNWGLNHMDKDWEPVWKSLGEDHVLELEKIYTGAMPQVSLFLTTQYPDASEEEILDAAAAVLDEQVAGILFVLGIWGDCAAQLRDGLYPELKYVVQTVKAAFNLMRTGDIHGKGDPRVMEAIKSIAFNQGDRFLARYADNGRSTIVGAKGPFVNGRGAHVINVDHDEQDMLAVSLVCPYLHEVGHDFRESVENLPEQQTESVVARIMRDFEAGKITLSSKTYKIGKQEVPAIALLAQIFGQTLSESDADIPRGTLLSGPAYRFGYHGVFGALNSKGRGIFATNRFLRSYGYFLVNEAGELVIEPHMIDYVRGVMIAQALRNRGFEAEAADSEAMSKQGAGVPTPKVMTWVNMDPKSKFKFKIQIPVEDLVAVAESVVDSIINDKLPCLGGLSAAELCDFTKHHQEKVDMLVKILMAGKSDVPTDQGDIYPTFVAAAAVTALWGLIAEGTHPVLAVAKVEALARKMLDTIAERAGDKPFVVNPEPTPVGGGDTTTPATIPASGNAGDGSASGKTDTTPPGSVPPARDTDAI